jgi:hypothetical protein
VRQVEVRPGLHEERLAARTLAELERARIDAEVAAEHGAQRTVADLVAPLVVGEAELREPVALRARQELTERRRIAVQRHGPDVHLARAERSATWRSRCEGGVEGDFVHAQMGESLAGRCGQSSAHRGIDMRNGAHGRPAPLRSVPLGTDAHA